MSTLAPFPLLPEERATVAYSTSIKSDPNILAAIVNLERLAGHLTAFRGQIPQPTTPR